MTSPREGALGRAGADLFAKISAEIASGAVPGGGYLPTIRAIAAKHLVGTKTVWRTLKAMEAQGLIAAKPRRGFRVLAKANDPERGCPIAYIGERDEAASLWDAFQRPLVGCLQDAAAERGWSLLAVKPGGLTAGELVERLRAVRAFGAIIDSTRPETVETVKSAGIPCVLVDTWIDGAGLDAVVQNGYLGGLLAAKHLLGLGCRRIAWFGMSGDDFHPLDRLGGALAGLAAANPSVSPELRFAPRGGDLEAEARRMLSGAKRPEAVIALWQGYTFAVKRAADGLGLKLGRDLELVGWCAEEMYDGFYRQSLGSGPLPATVTWSLETMAATAVSRLAERREAPGLPPLWLKIPVQLRPATDAGAEAVSSAARGESKRGARR
ncbi:MAG TPA: substrate-binding domain-containing protein [Planctomycetota bacterium]|nr:substrate-binding domain-containing protein [Planctomycetota bacterium]